MAIERIDSGLCNGCGTCVSCCPADVIRMDRESRKAVIKYPKECVLCCWCVKDCVQKAITVLPVRTSPLFMSWG